MGDFIVTADTLLSTGISLPSTSQGCNFNKRRKWVRPSRPLMEKVQEVVGTLFRVEESEKLKCVSPFVLERVLPRVLLGALPWVQLRKHPKLSSLENQSARGRLFAHSSIWVSVAQLPVLTDIRYEMLRQLPPAEQALLLDLYKSVWESHQFPTSCGLSGTVFHGGPLIRMSRREEFIMMRLRIEHSSLTHGFLLKGDPPPMDCVMIRGRRGTLHFVRFPTSEMGNFLVLAKSKGMATLVTTVFATGGGAFKFEDNFQTVSRAKPLKFLDALKGVVTCFDLDCVNFEKIWSDHMLLVLIAVFNAKSSDIQSCNAMVIQPV
uniref:Uncharacterized protein n=1 Tax=Timema poppense TaxID=170557 RepID=A0A7R9DCI5_TIMPO|nr:unnamed protein product [Timema poppensis]